MNTSANWNSDAGIHESGSHPMGTAGGPVGAIIGGITGAVTGGLIGKGVEEMVNSTEGIIRERLSERFPSLLPAVNVNVPMPPTKPPRVDQASVKR